MLACSEYYDKENLPIFIFYATQYSMLVLDGLT